MSPNVHLEPVVDKKVLQVLYRWKNVTGGIVTTDNSRGEGLVWVKMSRGWYQTDDDARKPMLANTWYTNDKLPKLEYLYQQFSIL
jgi:hypothetical protein